MTASETEISGAVGVSVSESPDLRVLGLSDWHLRDARAAIALHVLASGRSLAYGGDLRQHGFTELLFELLGRYKDHPRHRSKIVVTDYLAWPVHIRMTSNELTAFFAEHQRVARLVFLARNGTRLAREKRLELAAREPDDNEWAEGLTAMRTVMRSEILARIVLGGRVEGFKGAMPGIAEEVHLSIQTAQPVFLLGGFGGCTRDIAETIGIADRWAGSRDDWPGLRRFNNFSPDDCHNGLTLEENLVLARTPFIQQAVTLVSRGLRRIYGSELCDARKIH